MPDDTPAPDDLDVLVARAGLALSAAQRADLRAVQPHLREMAERMRTPRGREAEPAHVFAPLPSTPD